MTRSQLVVGTALVALGGLLLADQAGLLVDAGALLTAWWPLVVVLAGVAQVVTRPRNVVGAVVLGLLGLALLLWTAGPVDSVAFLRPVVLIGLGLWLLLGRVGTGRHTPGRTLDVTAAFGDRRATAPAGPFEGGALTTLLGDVPVRGSPVPAGR
jgi:hypothetical protein